MTRIALAIVGLLLANPAHALTVTIKCSARGVPVETFVSDPGGDLLAALRSATTKAEKDWKDSGGCYSVTVSPRLPRP